MYVCIYSVCVCACGYIYMCVYIYTHTQISTANPLCCIVETNTTLYNNYTLILKRALFTILIMFL